MKQKHFLPSYRNIHIENDHSLSNPGVFITVLILSFHRFYCSFFLVNLICTELVLYVQ